MKLRELTFSVLYLFSAISVIVAILAALFLKGEQEQTITLTSGVVLVICSSVKSRWRLLKGGGIDNSSDQAKVSYLPAILQNIISAVGGFSALFAGY